MSILTRGLGSTALGLDATADFQGQAVPLWGPSRLITSGLGNCSALTSHYPFHNTPIMGFYSAPRKESASYDITIDGNAYTDTISYGKILRDNAGNPVQTDQLRDRNGRFTTILTSVRPYLNYGTTFKSDPIGVAPFQYQVKPMGILRSAADGDIEYATMTPESHNPYNARSVQIIFPENAVLGPRSVQRLRFFLRELKEIGVNLRVKKDGRAGALLIELLDAKTSLKVLQKQIGQFLTTEELSFKFDMLSLQEYSGME
jgi:hypothetical protein